MCLYPFPYLYIHPCTLLYVCVYIRVPVSALTWLFVSAFKMVLSLLFYFHGNFFIPLSLSPLSSSISISSKNIQYNATVFDIAILPKFKGAHDRQQMALSNCYRETCFRSS